MQETVKTLNIVILLYVDIHIRCKLNSQQGTLISAVTSAMISAV
jgi:hypothetical protein